MSTLAIDVHNLSKRYQIGASERPDTLRDAMTGWLRRSRPRSDRQTLWALNNVSFQVEQGDLVGIVGHNGAGKSTLLKILSRITEPTRGSASVYGRIGSLLEVGTGFHPELTGRENIYLSGAMLGMTKAEIERKFDEIVAFSGVETMIDTPIKRYSSGMNVRLGFAVAAHLEPEILLVDEVLAVGDAAFQRKCLGKMSEVAQNGRTILFVSHNLVALQSLCERAIWLNNGQVAATGDAGNVVASYLRTTSDGANQCERQWPISAEAPGNDAVRLSRVAVQTPAGDAPALLDMATPFDVVVAYWNQVAGARLHVTLHVKTEQGVVAFSTFPSAENQGIAQPAGLVRATCRVPAHLLNSGVHRIDVLIVADKSRTLFRLDNALQFEVVDSAERGDGWFGREPGVVQPRLAWTTELVEVLP